jgi:signal transduction histidine kinase
MRERVEGLAGTLAIESEPGAGTTISASLPVPSPGGAQ